MTRRELLTTGLPAAGALALAQAAQANPTVTVYSWGRRYTVPGPLSPGREVYVLGEPPAAPRKTLLILYQGGSNTLTAQNQVGSELAAAFQKGQPAELAEWTICSIATPEQDFPDFWRPNYPDLLPITPPEWIPLQEPPLTNHYLYRWARRYEGGKTLWDFDFLPRVSAAIDSLVWAGYTDPDKVYGAGPSRGGILLAHAMAYEPRLKGGAFLNPVTRLFDLKPYFLNHPNPTLCAAEDVTNVAGQIADRSLLWVTNAFDQTVSTQAALDTYLAVRDAAGPTATWVPDHELWVRPVAGHARLTADELARVVAWMDVRAG